MAANISSPNCLPFLRWPGGKRWLAPHIARRVDDRKVHRYFEPFLGGGAVFFQLKITSAILSDINPELINTYVQVRDNADVVLARLRELSVDLATYEILRAGSDGSSLDRAVRFLYLNRTAFSGIYRLNRRGQFNVPYGGGQRSTKALWEKSIVSMASSALQGVSLQCCDFEDAVAEACDGDLVYFDPTYTVSHNDNGFRRYNEKNFAWEDQIRLASLCRRLAERGVSIFVSNAFHTEVSQLYDGFEKHTIERMSCLASRTQFRRAIREYLFAVNI